jgi:hypothetical protein
MEVMEFSTLPGAVPGVNTFCRPLVSCRHPARRIRRGLAVGTLSAKAALATPASKRRILCLSLFWHFLDLIWIEFSFDLSDRGPAMSAEHHDTHEAHGSYRSLHDPALSCRLSNGVRLDRSGRSGHPPLAGKRYQSSLVLGRSRSLHVLFPACTMRLRPRLARQVMSPFIFTGVLPDPAGRFHLGDDASEY